ncbi:MAG: SRPBCC domain-containing protein [Rhizobacter sp.]
MNHTTMTSATQQIVVEEVFPHAPETIWRLLTTGELMGRWFMSPMGFEPVQGKSFTFKTKPAGAWDGTIQCQVLDVVANERLAYSWEGGHEANVGYGSRLKTMVTWTLARVQQGTRLRLVHSGFVTPKNDTAYKGMGEGWLKVVHALGEIAGEKH